MSLTPFLRRWLPKQVADITTSPQSFRSKLLPDDDAVELELGALHTSASDYELRQITRSNGSVAGTLSSDQDATGLPQAGQTESSRDTVSTNQVDHPLAEADHPCITPTILHEKADSLQQWQQSSAAVRLVVGVLLECASSCSACRQQLDQLLACCSWLGACQQLECGQLLRALLQHYFPSVLEPQQLVHAGGSHGSCCFAHVEGRYASTSDNSSSSSTADLYVAAARAAGMQPPHDVDSSSSNGSSTTKGAAEPLQLLQLLAALVVAGELQQLLQDSLCGQVLQRMQQQKQQHTGQPAEAAALQLLQKWWHAAAGLAQCAATVPCSSINAKHNDSSSTSLTSRRQDIQQHEVGGRIRALQPCSFQDVVGLLLQWQQQQQHTHTSSGDSTSSNASSSEVAGASSAGTSSSQVLLQLQQLGCSMPLLQPADLHGCCLPAPAAAASEVDQTATAAAASRAIPGPLQLVLLLRLVGSTSHLWVASLQQQQQQQQDGPAAAGAAVPLLLGGLSHSISSDAAQDQAQLSGSSDGTEAADELVALDAAAAAAAVAPGSVELERSSSSSAMSPRNSWPAELLATTQLWPGEESDADAAAISREERTLRCWINSLLHRSRAGESAAAAATAAGGSAGRGLRHSASGSQENIAIANTCGGVVDVKGAVDASGWEDLAVLSITASAGAGLSGLRSISCDAAPAAAAAVTPGSISSSSSSSDGGQAPLQDPLQASSKLVLGPTRAASIPAAATATAAPPAAAAAAASNPSGFSFPSIGSLFGPELRSGVLLLELLELLQPGCVDWRLANKLPFKMGGARVQLLALENCQMALQIAKEELGLPLVSMSPHDVVLGRRKVILSLVYQLMRFHTMQLLESIITDSTQQQQQGGATAVVQEEAGLPSDIAAAAAAGQGPSPSVTPRAAAAAGAGGRVNFFSSSKKQRRLAISEADILRWANNKLLLVQPLGPAAAAAADISKAVGANSGLQSQLSSSSSEARDLVARPKIASFRDPVLQSGVVLLQLLHVLDSSAVDMAFVTPGLTPAQRQSNAKYALSVADKMGCSLFLVWEDLVDLQPRMVLVLLASLMYMDQTRHRGQQQQQQQ